MSSRIRGQVIVLAFVLVAGARADSSDLVSLFDGKTLDGWVPEHTDHFTVRDGVIVNNGGTGWLRSAKPYKDFEFQAEYRALQPRADSGLFFHASAESTPQGPRWPATGYQLQVIDAESNLLIFGHGTPPPRCDRKTDALKTVMKKAGEWQQLTLKVVGKRAEASLNGMLITVSDAINLPEGHIGLQGENGQFEWRNLKIRVLSPP